MKKREEAVLLKVEFKDATDYYAIVIGRRKKSGVWDLVSKHPDLEIKRARTLLGVYVQAPKEMRKYFGEDHFCAMPVGCLPLSLTPGDDIQLNNVNGLYSVS